MAIALTGIGVSKGYAIGAARVLRREHVEVPQYEIGADEVHAEIERYNAALADALHQLRALRAQIPRHTPPEIAAFIDTHLLMLDDVTLRDGPVKLIKSHRHNAEWALKLQRDVLVDTFEEIDDTYLRTRKDDIDHVVARVLRALLKHPHESTALIPDRLRGAVVVADDISPTEAVYFHQHGVAGIVSEHGGPTSHTAILARNLGIPALVGVAHARRAIIDDETLIVDANTGTLLAGTDAAIARIIRRRQLALARYRASLAQLRETAATTLDRHSIGLYANIELPDDIAAARKAGAAGIGLYRTEFLFMDRTSFPDEDEQYLTYARLARAFKDAPVVIRTLDIGADKDPRAAGGVPARNPALGLRGVRFSLHDPMLFKIQLRAILRASAHGNVRLMFPMLSGLQELAQVTQLLEEVKGELATRGVRFNARIPLGCVIETPAAALLSGRMARCLDFMSIGTNDLVQYTLAVDRTDTSVSHLFDPTHPAVLMLIHTVIRNGARARVPVTVCGEMAGDVRYTRLLLGLGLREFSMHPSALLEVKRIIQTTHTGKLRARVRRILASLTSQEAAELIEKLNR